jgi:NTE family protein
MLEALTAGLAGFQSARASRRGQSPIRRRPGGGVKPISLALQGGGAHGAFTWGVIDHLLEDERLTIAGVSGTSAGAVNAVLLADGLARGGPQEARKRLADFWRAASLGGGLPDPQRAVLDRMLSFMPGRAPMQNFVHGMSRYLSPYELNPLNINPLKDLIASQVDFKAVCAFKELDLFISATNVHTGGARVFTREEITADTVMASAALPLMFRAVEIDGVPYWDGGYSGNPAITPLLGGKGGADVLVVQIMPLEQDTTPHSAREIINRISEINFNASLTAEIKMIDLLAQMIDQGHLKPGPDFRPVNLHRIVLDGGPQVTSASQLNNDYEFFKMLHRAGQCAAQQFLESHFDDIGVRGTLAAEQAAA